MIRAVRRSRKTGLAWRRCATLRAHAWRGLAWLALVALLAPPAGASEGSLRVTAPLAGRLVLEQASGWERWVAIEAGTTTLWQLPAGTYRARFVPGLAGAAEPQASGIAGDLAAPPAESSAPPRDRIRVWPDLTSAIRIDAGSLQIEALPGPDQARGALLMLGGATLRALPGKKESILASLDTHTRWRPSARLDGRTADLACERRELLPGDRAVLGPSWSAVSASAPATHAALWNLSVEPALGPAAAERSNAADGWLDLVAGARQNSYEGRTFGADARLTRPLWGAVAVRGLASLRYADLTDAFPRARANGTLPHNDAEQLDLLARFRIGHPTPLLLRGGAAPETAAMLQGAGDALQGDWSLSLALDSRGWRRNHYLEAYRYNLTHAPYEETALFRAAGDLDWRLSRQTSARLHFGYDRYLTRLTDGLYKGDLAAYASLDGNGAADDSGLYWSDGTGDLYGMPHVFDYYLRKLSERRGGELTLTHAAGERDLLLSATLAAQLDSYRRYEHFAPAEVLSGLYDNALAIGYDPTGERRAETPYRPGEPLHLRGAFAGQWAPHSRWRLDVSLGAYYFDARDSALVSLSEPLGADDVLGPEDLRPSETHLLPEVSLGLRRKSAGGMDLWGLGYQRAIPAPLEALYGPRAHLDLRRPEGVMGNPDLGPERETGAELGMGVPVSLGGKRLDLTAAAYAGRLSDAITMRYADLPASGASGDTLLAAYEGGGVLRRWGLHLEAVWGGRLAAQRGRGPSAERDYVPATERGRS
ncbi:MAG: hypothetical protein GF330_10790, partial [Candidatus Eisenbacteria bacterium]|nr:hypothetical protein [Candidatus Eisenbacteria bacterium]